MNISKRHIKPFFILLLISLMTSSCAVEPKPIDYGSDNCAYCLMTIVDKQHAAEIVTEKGKVYKYDAIECMINHHLDKPQQSVALYLINDYENPGDLIDAVPATYLIHPEIKSPMGANLSGFASREAAEKRNSAHLGKIYSWDSLLTHFINNR